MTNQEIADRFTALIPEGASKDFYDRFLDLAIYVNETTLDDSNRAEALLSLETALEDAYACGRI